MPITPTRSPPGTPPAALDSGVAATTASSATAALGAPALARADGAPPARATPAATHFAQAPRAQLPPPWTTCAADLSAMDFVTAMDTVAHEHGLGPASGNASPRVDSEPRAAQMLRLRVAPPDQPAAAAPAAARPMPVSDNTLQEAIRAEADSLQAEAAKRSKIVGSKLQPAFEALADAAARGTPQQPGLSLAQRLNEALQSVTISPQVEASLGAAMQIAALHACLRSLELPLAAQSGAVAARIPVARVYLELAAGIRQDESHASAGWQTLATAARWPHPDQEMFAEHLYAGVLSAQEHRRKRNSVTRAVDAYHSGCGARPSMVQALTDPALGRTPALRAEAALDEVSMVCSPEEVSHLRRGLVLLADALAAAPRATHSPGPEPAVRADKGDAVCP